MIRFGIAVLATALVGVIGVPQVAADGNESPGTAAFRSMTGGGYHTCGILENGQVKCWGYNGSGQLGLGDTTTRGDGPGEMGASLPAVDLGTGRTATALAAGDSYTCALLDDGTVKCWGSGYRGALGLGSTADRGDGPNEMGDDLPLVDLGTGVTATAITAGYDHTCALLSDGRVKCWGSGAGGKLGNGSTAYRGDGGGEMGDALPAVALGTGRTATAVSAGGNHTCAVLDNGQVKCWGDAGRGELGNETSDDRGDGPNEMGDFLPAVDLGTGRTAVGISASDYHTCALLDDESVKCWGYNGYGQLGQGDVVDRGDDSGEMGDALPAVDLGTGRTAVAVITGEYDHTCALLDTGRARCWGDGYYGALGNGSTAYWGDGAGEMGDVLPMVDVGVGRLLGLGASARPDAHVRKGTAAYVGLDVYNATGLNQSRAGTAGPRGQLTFTVRIENDGSVADRFRVRGAGSTTKFTVAYLRGATNITGQVTGAGFTTPYLAAGEATTVTLRITATASAVRGNTITRLVTITSLAVPTVKDAVKATFERV